MSKFLGFLLGIAAAVGLPAGFGVLAAEGGVELNAKEMALAYGIGALIFWAIVSLFSGAAALGAALMFGLMIYAVHWIPNRTTNFLNDVPGVTTGMIDGLKQYVLNGVIPILAVISLVYAIQSMVRAVRRRRQKKAEAERLLREQEAAQAAEVAGGYPAAAAAGGEYAAESRFSNFGNSSYDDLFDEEPTPVRPRSQADEQTMQFPASERQVADGNDVDQTLLVPSDRDETAQVPVAEDERSEQTAQAEAPAPQEQGPEPTAAQLPDRTAEQAPDQTAEQAPDQAPGQAAGEAETGQAAESGTPERGGAGRDEIGPPPGAAAGATSAQASQAQVGQPPAAAQGPAVPEETPGPLQGGGPQQPQGGVVQQPQDGAVQQPYGEAPQQPQSGAAEEAQGGVPQEPRDQGRPEQAGPGARDQGAQAVAGAVGVQEVGQQYRERMEGFNPEDTGEFHLGAFESPMPRAAGA